MLHLKRIILFLLFTGASLNVFSQELIEKFRNKVNGIVRSIAVDKDNCIIYLGGEFTRAGKLGAYGAPLDKTTALVPNTENQPNGTVWASFPDGEGGYYIGGNFTRVGNQERYHLAHIRSDGTVSDWGERINLNGSVRAIHKEAGTVYVGGDFTAFDAYHQSSGVALSGIDGQPYCTFPKVNGEIFATVPDGNGGFYIGGDFTMVGEKSRNRTAHINAQGEVTDWDPNANSRVLSLAVDGSLVYAGGDFTSIGGQSRTRIAALDAATGDATSWNPNANNSVLSLTVDGATVYAGGAFTSIGGQSRNYITALDSATGNATPWNPNASSYVRSLAMNGATVYAGGYFNSIGGQSRSHIAALDAATGNATSWNPNANNSVWSLAIGGATVYIGGNFTSIGGQSRNRIAALDAATGNATSWNPNANGSVRSLTVDGATVYAGGYFTSIGGQSRNRIAALEAATGNAASWNPDANGVVHSLAVDGAIVYAGGGFTSLGEQIRNYITSLDTATGNATSWNPDANGSVRSLTVDGATVYAGGYFTSIGGQSRNRIAALDAAMGNATSWNPDAGAVVLSLAVDGAIVYAGGGFTSIGGQIRGHIAALDVATGNVTSWNPNASSSVTSLAMEGATVYAGGYFSSIGGQSRNHIAALDAVTGNATSWNPNANGSVHSLAVDGATVYAGGNFTIISGQSRSRIAALDAATGNAASWGPNANGDVFSLAVEGATVYAGGDFTSIGGQNRNRIAALDAATGNVTSWNPDANGVVRSLAVEGATVYAGGAFTSIGGQSRNRIAALDAATGNATPWNPNANNIVLSLAVDGTTVYAGGAFTSISGQSRNRIAALEAATGNATSWNPNANISVWSLAIDGATVYAGGDFTNIGGQSRIHIAALEAATGNATPWNPNANSVVYSLAVDGAIVYAGGYFTDIGGQSRNYIAALDLATGNATSWNPNANSDVFSLAVEGKRVYAGGLFTSIGGQGRNYIAALDSATGNATSWNPNANDYVRSLAMDGTMVYAGGAFTSIGEQSLSGFAGLTGCKFDQTISFDPLAFKTYGDVDFDLSASATSGLEIAYASSDETVVTIAGSTVTIKGPGNTIITASQEGNENYKAAEPAGQALTINKASLNITADDKSKSYGETNPVLTVSYFGFVNGDDESVLDTPPIASTLATASSDAGTFEITLSAGADNNYEITDENGTLTINKALLTTTADNKIRTYGQNNPALTVSYSGFVNGEDESVLDTPSTASTLATATSNAGIYDITLTAGVDNNYEITDENGTLTINKALLTTIADNKTRTYGQNNPALTVSYSGFVNGDDESVLDTPPAASTVATASSSAETYDITLTAGVDNNYEITDENGTLTINKATLSAKADAKSKIYGQNNPALTVSYSGFVNGDDESVLDTPPAASTVATASSNAGTYEIILSTGSDNNYEITDENGTLTINKATLSAKADAKSKIYGQNNPVLTVSFSGFVNGDDESVLDTPPAASTVATASSNAGTYEITLSTGSDNNYEITLIDGKLTVIKADQMITFEPLPEIKNKNSDDFDLSATASSGLPVSFSSGNPAIVTISGITVSIFGSGEVLITAIQPGDNNYNAAPPVSQTLVVPVLLGLPDKENSGSDVYPNPASKHFMIRPGDHAVIDKIHLVNIEGKVVRVFKYFPDTQFDISDLVNGSYLLLIESDKNNGIARTLLIRR
jgi:hypothetical protein